MEEGNLDLEGRLSIIYINDLRKKFRDNGVLSEHLSSSNVVRAIIKGANRQKDPAIAQLIILRFLFIVDRLKYSIGDEWATLTYEHMPSSVKQKWHAIYGYLTSMNSEYTNRLFA